MEVMLRRSKFRDYYDIYSLLEAGVGLYDMIGVALRYSGHRLKTKKPSGNAYATRPVCGRFKVLGSKSHI